MDSCQEFDLEEGNFELKTLNVDTYPHRAFILDLKFSSPQEFLQKLDLIQKNGWLNETRSKALCLGYLISLGTHQIIDEQLVIEKWNGKMELSVDRLKITDLSTSPLKPIFAVVYLLAAILYIMRVIFECSYSYRQTQICLLAVTLSEILYCIVQLIWYSLAVQQYADLSRRLFSAEFMNLYQIRNLNKILSMLNLITIFCQPFKVFLLISYSQIMQIFVGFSNMIYRTLWPLAKIMGLLLLVFVPCWGLSYHVALRSLALPFTTYFSSVANLFLFDINSFYEQRLSLYNLEHTDNLISFCLVVLYAIRLLCFTILLQIILVSLKLSLEKQFNFRISFDR